MAQDLPGCDLLVAFVVGQIRIWIILVQRLVEVQFARIHQVHDAVREHAFAQGGRGEDGLVVNRLVCIGTAHPKRIGLRYFPIPDIGQRKPGDAGFSHQFFQLGFAMLGMEQTGKKDRDQQGVTKAFHGRIFIQ